VYDLTQALELKKRSGHQKRAIGSLSVELVDECIRKHRFLHWCHGSSLPRGAGQDHDRLDEVSLISAAEFLSTFLKSDKAVLASYECSDGDFIEDDGLFAVDADSEQSEP
jgi:hypothetical protein